MSGARWLSAKLRAQFYIDAGPPDATTLVCGMGRSGTTWVAQLINHDCSYRMMFEPFHPARVPEARPFEYIQYLSPRDDDPARVVAARRILAGRLRNPAVDEEQCSFLFRRRLIKDIRCNLMLGWLSGIQPSMPIVLVMRNPLAVAASWSRLGWGTESRGVRTDFDIITSQPALLQDFPELRRLASQVDTTSSFDRILFQWCAFHLVPFRHFPGDRLFHVRYEDLMISRDQEIERLFRFLGTNVDRPRLSAAFGRPSSTSFPDAAGGQPSGQRLAVRPQELSDQQIERAVAWLTFCGLECFYDSSGMHMAITNRGPSQPRGTRPPPDRSPPPPQV